MINTIDSLEKIKKEVAVCVKCKLARSRTKTVPGEGNSDADIIFIGEGPGANEDREGIPFCGAAGKFLEEMLAIINLKRSDVFITNTVKCRPPGNRDPEPEEKSACRPYLNRQFNLIKPKLIVCLGRHSMASFLPDFGSITSLHGKAITKDGKLYLALYHPAAALYNGALRETLINDFKKIPEIIMEADKKDMRGQDEDKSNEDKSEDPQRPLKLF